ncbi:hypothetical protein J1614_008443 [Plenodomus biglobosus]|nr:hypothetical protein J1614_008443 [Plenodomus biglobosus]
MFSARALGEYAGVAMRLLECLSNGDFKLVSFNDENPPPYAILSHTWTEGQEVTHNELVAGTGKNKTGYSKIRFCGRRAAADNLEYFWVDTCCIDKSTSHELSTAINSMFRWYQRASKCYVYLSDIVVPEEVADAEAFQITWAEAFRRSRWFTRGWTLQELLAPPCVEFFSKNGKRLGSRISLEQQIHEITKVPTEALRGQSLAEFSVKERMSWAAQRTTTWKEDKVYCLLGIFGVFLSLIYGEGEAYAALRLREEIERRQEGQGTEKPHDLFVSSVLPSSRNKLLARQEHQRPGDNRKRKRQDLTIQQCKRCCQLLQRNIPPQVLLETPIILFDGFNECFAFSLNFISSLDSFRDLMAGKAREVLEDRFKEKGYAKIWEGDFLLQDQHRRNLDLRRPWKFIMKPGEQRYMSIKFRENMWMQTSCPHCGMENNALEGQATFCQSCQVTYERIVDLDEEDTTKDGASRIPLSKNPPKSPPKHGITEEELKYCFRRLALTAPAPPTWEYVKVTPGNQSIMDYEWGPVSMEGMRK